MSCILSAHLQSSISMFKTPTVLCLHPESCSRPIHSTFLPTTSSKLLVVSKYLQGSPALRFQQKKFVCFFGGNKSDETFSFPRFENQFPVQKKSISLLSLSKSSGRVFRCPTLASSGLEASITDSKDSSLTIKNAKFVVEFQEEKQLQLRVELTGDDTQKVFDKVLVNLARTAPPVPGFRREKGGKTSKVPKSFLLQILGEERVTKFVIQEIVNSTLADYVNKENLKVKDNKISTTQSAEELKKLFAPGNEFGFNAVVELEKSETETLS